MVSLSKFNISSINDKPLPFGKYRGSTPNEIIQIDPQYLVWVFENVEGFFMTEELYQNSQVLSDEDDYLSSYLTDMTFDHVNIWGWD